MGFRDSVRNLFGSGKRIPVVDAKQASPTVANIPHRWSSFMGPGTPVSGLLVSAREQDRDLEPRSFQYSPNVNATISPRIAYGLMSFSDLRDMAEGVPEVSMCVRIITEEIKAFRPRILAPDSTECKDPALRWMIQSPDRFNPYPVWLSRFLYNVLVYDAGALYRVRNQSSQITGLRVVDGSTLFVIIDEHGEQPTPPAPAFSQVIYGVPRNYFNSHQIWYRPRHLRADAPYGRSPIEDCLPAVKLLSNIWQYQTAWYTEGTTPDTLVAAPREWTPDQILEFERTFNDRMAGNTAERAGRVRFLPNGSETISTKDATFNQAVYDVAANTVRMTFGIPRTEFGETPGTGLGGSGFLEAMQNVFYRMGIAPMKSYIESVFNDVLEENGYRGYEYELAFPNESIDPKKEEDKTMARFTAGVITRDETREALGLEVLGGEEGGFLNTPGGAQESPFSLMDTDKIPVRGGGKIPVRNGKVPVSDKVPVSGGETIPVTEDDDIESIPVRKMWGVDPEDDSYFGAPINKDGIGWWTHEKGLPDRVVSEVDPLNEVAYLIDRTVAKNDQSYLVPVTYQIQGAGVSLADIGGDVDDPSGFDTALLEQAAVLDYIAGVTRPASLVRSHPDDPERPYLVPVDTLMGDPDSPFVSAVAGKPLSRDTLGGVAVVIGDAVLWSDIADIAGSERAEAARARAEAIFTAEMIPPLGN
jgi:hypothetical protein